MSNAARSEGLAFIGDRLTAGDATFEQEIYDSTCAPCRSAGLKRQPDWKHRLENSRRSAPPYDKTGPCGTLPTVSCSDILVLEDQ